MINDLNVSVVIDAFNELLYQRRLSIPIGATEGLPNLWQPILDRPLRPAKMIGREGCLAAGVLLRGFAQVT
jgi:hypothetical protein